MKDCSSCARRPKPGTEYESSVCQKCTEAQQRFDHQPEIHPQEIHLEDWQWEKLTTAKRK